ncbi:hypothetical protein RJ639_036224 [Escallonia herrerae]|uniref:Exostosin GT47 domain-containing protein n=1 Tax=Escallonia herrerae TaxID=1293975 RepID=A0AA88X400_9ASTE|nr:hypothetical protein RJ639_036224 [Escallonia herrerae]
MAPKNTAITTSLCSDPSLFISLSLVCTLSLSLFFLSYRPQSHPPLVPQNTSHSPTNSIKVYVSDLPRYLNYGLLDKYWSFQSDSRLGSDADKEIRSAHLPKRLDYPPYPENPLIKQYSAEYWIMGDLMMPEKFRTGSFARRVFDAKQADVVFVPFFATLSAEMQLGMAKGMFRKKAGNEDYDRQKEVVDFVRGVKLGSGPHSLADPVAMWHVRAEIAPAILLVVDFGGWYRLDSKMANGSSSVMVQHTQVSLLKDVIVPYSHLLPKLLISEDQKHHTLLYFKGAKHRHRGGLIREKLWDLLVNEPQVIIEEGFPNATGKEQSIKGMRSSEFCLHPAGDTPTSCRLFDAIQSLCIPVIVSDEIVLPFEGMVDYSDFSVFVALADALQPNWLVSHLKSYSVQQKDSLRQNMARIQHIFEYDNGYPGGIGPVPVDGAVNQIWKKVHQKMPLIKEAIVRERRKPPGVSVPLRCHCT